MVDDGDRASVSVAQNQIGNAHEPISPNADFKPILYGEDLLLAKAVKGVEVGKTFLEILACQFAGKGWKAVLDCLVVFALIRFRQFKGHELALCPAFKDIVTMDTVLSIGISFLRHAVDILELEGQRTPIKLLKL